MQKPKRHQKEKISGEGMWEIFLQAFPTASTRPGAITTRSSRHRNFREPELTTTTRSYHDPELTTSQFSRSSRQRPGAITTRSSRHHYHQDRTLLLVFFSASPSKCPSAQSINTLCAHSFIACCILNFILNTYSSSLYILQFHE